MWRTLVIFLWWFADFGISTFISYDIDFSRYSPLVLISTLKWTSSIFQKYFWFASTDYLRQAGYTKKSHLSRNFLEDLSNSKKYVARLVAFGLTKWICLKTIFKKLQCAPPPPPLPTTYIYFDLLISELFIFELFIFELFIFELFIFELFILSLSILGWNIFNLGSPQGYFYPATKLQHFHFCKLLIFLLHSLKKLLPKALKSDIIHLAT